MSSSASVAVIECLRQTTYREARPWLAVVPGLLARLPLGLWWGSEENCSPGRISEEKKKKQEGARVLMFLQGYSRGT